MRLGRRASRPPARSCSNGEPLPVGDPAASLRRGVATIYQELDLVEELTVAQSVFLAHEPRRGPFLDLERMRRDSATLLARLGHEGIDPRKKIGELRPAAQQVVSIARALSHDVRLLIMDEPSAILDDGEIETLFEVVRRLTADGVAVIYISHRLDEIRRIGDRVTVLSDGRTAATGLPASTPTDRLVELMVGRAVEQLYPDRPSAPGEVVLDVRGLRRLPEVRSVTLQVRAGEVVGLGGLVGSGRTELLRADLRARRAGRGRGAGRRQAPAAGTARPCDRRRARPRPGGPQVAGSAAANGARRRTSASPTSAASSAGCSTCAPSAPRCASSCADCRPCPTTASASCGELSGGNQQKVVLARWLLHHCRVLLLDEPTRGVDVATKAELYRVITDLAAEGVALLVVSSELGELVGICNRIIVMREGQTVFEVAGDRASERELLRHAVAPTESADLIEEVR